MKCRHCNAPLHLPLIDLGSAPPSNAYLNADQVLLPEATYPLKVMVCTNCWLAQTEDYARPDVFFADDYAYYSSYSASWLAHAKAYVRMAVDRFKLDDKSLVVEVASNDGYLLRYVKEKCIPCLGIEPTAGTAAAARELGIPVVEEFFGVELAEKLVSQGKSARLMVANNVLAHVPDINDFVAGFSSLLAPDGVATFEFPHLVELVVNGQFDTIYHEHFSYLSLTAVQTIFSANGLSVFDVEKLPTHGGSLRVFAQRSDSGKQPRFANVDTLLSDEADLGLKTEAFYSRLQASAESSKAQLLDFLNKAKRNGKKIAAYGAAAKGNTFLNFAQVDASQIDFVVDRNPFKQGKFLPGSKVPIVGEDALRSARPDYVLLLPWNLRAELESQLAYVRSWGAKIVTAIPTLEVQ